MELTSTSSGVPIQRRICGVKITPITVNPTPATRPSATVVWIVRRILSQSLAPKYRATTTPAPNDTPLTKPVSRKIRLPDEPTAASASPPRKLPTISESAALYSCWNRLLIKIGSANSSIPLATLPWVRVVFCFVSIVCFLYTHILSGRVRAPIESAPTGVIRRGGFHIRPQSAVCLHQYVLDQ